MVTRGYLLDTNVISETVKRNPHPGVLRFLESAEETELYLSVLSLGEIRRGIHRLAYRDAAYAARLGAWADDLKVGFEERLLDVGAEIAERWGRLTAGRDRAVIDALLAATALHHGLTLVTRNVSDFSDSGVSLIDPWEA